MKFEKTGENTHGSIVRVIDGNRGVTGIIEKWHGLFVGIAQDGTRFMPEGTRGAAAAHLRDHWDFENCE